MTTIVQSPKAQSQNYMGQQQSGSLQGTINSIQRIPSGIREPTTPIQSLQKQPSMQSINQQQNSTNQNSNTQQQQRIVRSSVAYVKMLKNADNTKLILQKQKEERTYNEKEKFLFDQFHEYKNIQTHYENLTFSTEDVDLKKEMDRLIQINKKKQNELKILEEKEKKIAEDNEYELSNSSMQKSFFTMSRMNQSSTYPDQEQLVYINSIYKMKKSLNASTLTLKQTMNPSLIFEAIEQLLQNQQKVHDMTEVQLDTMGQLEKKVDEIKICIDKIQKEKNQIIDMNALFDKKFMNLELREINAQKKNEEAGQITQTYHKELEETYYRSQMALQEKQQEKSDIYNEIKHLKHEITVCLIDIDKKKLIRDQQQAEIQKLEQKERDLIVQLNESKYIINYIDSIEKLEKIFLNELNEDEEIENYLRIEQQSTTIVSFSPTKRKLDTEESYQSTIKSRDRIEEIKASEKELEKSQLDSNLNSPRKATLKQSYNELEQNRNILVERLKQFYENHKNGPNETIENLKKKLVTLKVLSQSLHKRYQELIDMQQEKQLQIRELDEIILDCKREEKLITDQKMLKDKTEDVAPPEDYENYVQWMRFHTLPHVQKKQKVQNKTIQEIHSGNNLEEEDEQEMYAEEEAQHSMNQIQQYSQHSLTNQENEYTLSLKQPKLNSKGKSQNGSKQQSNRESVHSNENTMKPKDQDLEEEEQLKKEEQVEDDNKNEEDKLKNNENQDENEQVNERDQEQNGVENKEEDQNANEEENNNEIKKQDNLLENKEEQEEEQQMIEKTKQEPEQNLKIIVSSNQNQEEEQLQKKTKNKQFQQNKNLQLSEESLNFTGETFQKNEKQESPQKVISGVSRPRVSKENIKILQEKQSLQIPAKQNKDNLIEQEEDEENIDFIMKKLDEQQKQALKQNSTINQMQIYIAESSKFNKNQIRKKIDQFEKFGFKVYQYLFKLNKSVNISIQLIKRLTQIALDISRKTKSVMSDKQFEQFGEELKKFVSGLRKGVAVKRNTNSNKIQFIEANPEPKMILNELSIQIRQSVKKMQRNLVQFLTFQSFMEPLVKRFEKEKNRTVVPINKENSTLEENQSPPTPTAGPGYLPTSVNVNDQKKNRMEKFLDIFSYVPLDYPEIENIYLTIFPEQKQNCKLFIQAIKEDMYLSFFESLDSIAEYLQNIYQEYEDDEEMGSVQAIKKIYILKEQSQKHHWKNIKEIFEQYLKFQTTLNDKIQEIWSNASISLKRAFKNKIQKMDNKLQKKYQEFVIDKLGQYKNESQPLSEPITENKMVNLKDLEESAKEKANTDDLKKIIFKLANTETAKKPKYGQIQESPQKKKNNQENLNGNNFENSVDDDEINLLDQNTKKQLKYQNMTEDEYLQYESRQVKNDAEGANDNLLFSLRNQSAAKLHDKREFYQHKTTTSYQYLKSFVESDKVIWKLRKQIFIHKSFYSYKIVENTKDFKDKFSTLQLDDYVPKNKKPITRDSFYNTKQSEATKQDYKNDYYSIDEKKKKSQFNSIQSKQNSISLQQFKPQLEKNKSTLLTPLSKTLLSDYYRSTTNSYSQSSSMLTSREQAQNLRYSTQKQTRDDKLIQLPIINQLAINNPSSSVNLKYLSTKDVYSSQSPPKDSFRIKKDLNKNGQLNQFSNTHATSKGNGSIHEKNDKVIEEVKPKTKLQKQAKLMENLLNQERIYLSKK